MKDVFDRNLRRFIYFIHLTFQQHWNKSAECFTLSFVIMCILACNSQSISVLMSLHPSLCEQV